MRSVRHRGEGLHQSSTCMIGMNEMELKRESHLISPPSRLRAPDVPRRPEADSDGGDEVTGHTAGRRLCRSEGGSAQDGNPHCGGSAAGSAATQAEAQRHERPDAVGLLGGRLSHPTFVTCRVSVVSSRSVCSVSGGSADP